jgi:hypothetical protein
VSGVQLKDLAGRSASKSVAALLYVNARLIEDAVFTGTNHIVGRLIASQSASAPAASFLPRFVHTLS